MDGKEGLGRGLRPVREVCVKNMLPMQHPSGYDHKDIIDLKKIIQRIVRCICSFNFAHSQSYRHL